MKQLTVFEMEEISGGTGDFFNSALRQVGAVGLGACIGAIFGSFLGGRWGGDGGGLIGIGAAAQGVGMIWGLVVGGIAMGIFGGIVGYDDIYDIAMDSMNGLIDGTFNLWSGGSSSSINSLIDMVISYL